MKNTNQPTNKKTHPAITLGDIAVLRAKLLKATCILGSATPSLESLHNVSLAKYSLSELTQRVDNRELPLIHLVDMQRENDKRNNLSILSQPLVEPCSKEFKIVNRVFFSSIEGDSIQQCFIRIVDMWKLVRIVV